MAVMGSGAVEAWVARAKDRPGKNPRSIAEIIDFWCIWKMGKRQGIFVIN